MYNVTAAEGILGVEIRPISQDDVEGLKFKVGEHCDANGLELRMNVMENGVACDPNTPALKALIEAVKQAVVWEQSGLGPHAKDERRYISRIKPYYKLLNELAKLWK